MIFLKKLFNQPTFASHAVLPSLLKSRVHMAAILDFHENRFLRHSKIPHRRKMVEHASMG